MRPWLIVKAARADVLLAFLESRMKDMSAPYANTELDLYEEIKLLNKR